MNNFRTITIECNVCGNEYAWPHDDGWQHGWEQAKREGWAAAKVGELWVRACPTCDLSKVLKSKSHQPQGAKK